jgi:uncharacterized damage-inducible protein DinB
VSDDGTRRDLIGFLEGTRSHVLEQVRALPPAARRESRLPSGWTPLAVVRHLALDVERVWFRAVMGGADVELPVGYEGWTVPPEESDEAVLASYVEECRAATAVIAEMDLHKEPRWWFSGAGDPPYSSLREVVLHVLVETATHAGHLDICRELVDGGQRLVLDAPD